MVGVFGDATAVSALRPESFAGFEYRSAMQPARKVGGIQCGGFFRYEQEDILRDLIRDLGAT